MRGTHRPAAFFVGLALAACGVPAGQGGEAAGHIPTRAQLASDGSEWTEVCAY